jgi:hypothetical protein
VNAQRTAATAAQLRAADRDGESRGGVESANKEAHWAADVDGKANFVAVNTQNVLDNRHLRVGWKAAVHPRFNETAEKVRYFNDPRRS